MYPALGDTPSNSMIELHNRGPKTVDLTAWHLEEASQTQYSEATVIPPGESLVIASDSSELQKAHLLAEVGGPFNGTLLIDRIESF